MSDTVQLTRKSLPAIGQKGRTILTNKPKKVERVLPTIEEDGKIVTPKPLNPEAFTSGKERQITASYDVTGAEQSEASQTISAFRKSKSLFQTEYDKQQFTISTSMYKGSIHYDSNFMDSLLLDDDEDTGKSEFSSMFDTLHSESIDLESEEENLNKTPQHVSLRLNETSTCILLDIPSATAVRDSEEGNLVDEENQQYEYLTVGKGRNRKVLHAEVQTVPILMKSRHTNPEKIRYRPNTAFASNWEMYDTYQDVKEEVSEDSDFSETHEIGTHRLEETTSLDSFRISIDEKQLAKLLKSPRFMEAVCVMERLLANNCYNEQQKRFIGLSDPSEFRENIEYKYNLNLLWTFANANTKERMREIANPVTHVNLYPRNSSLILIYQSEQHTLTYYLFLLGRSVNAMHWNPHNKDLVAIGYGKFFFADYMTGLVNVWNIKNPVQPERNYHFPRSVTALNFSTADPNLLAVGCYNGYVVIINIISREKMIVGENTPTFEPVRDLRWRVSQYELNNREQVCAAFDDGRVIAYSVSKKLQGQEIMRVPKADGKLKGYDSMGMCSNLSIPVSRYAAAFFITQHPAQETIYFIGTNMGVIHKCSTHYFTQHLDHFLAHDGPVYEMKFSPFSKKIYATCGDDWHARVWAEDISEPLLELYTSMQSVQGIDWSPTHSTILVTILGPDIKIWDFQRKVYEPQSTTRSPTGTKNTIVQFIDSGRCLVVGDIDGNVHVFSLEDMPFTAFFQENLLFDSLFRALTTNPKLLEKLKKLHRSIEEK